MAVIGLAFLRRAVARVMAARCATLGTTAQAETISANSISTSSPYNESRISWSTPATAGVAAQRLFADRTEATQPSLPPYTFESSLLPNGAQTLININSKEAPNRYVFPVELNDNSRIELMNDGTVSLNSNRFPQGSFEKPWATDANGKPVPTHFEVEDDKLVQIVEFGPETAFPVVADPRFNWGVASGHSYLNKSETRATAAAAAGGGLAALPWLALVPPPFSLAVGTNLIGIGIWATAAVAQDKCLALKFGTTGDFFPPTIGVSPEHHTGNDCY